MLCMMVGISAWAESVTGTITFNTNNVKISSASVTGNDTQGNTWTIATEGTTSFTGYTGYYQVGSSSKPATSITFTTTLSEDVNITAMSATFGGFSNTAGTVTLKVGDTSVGTGTLNGTDGVIVTNTSTATGKVLTVTVTDISKGVKVYSISYTYETKSTSSVTSPTFSLAAGSYIGTQSVTLSADEECDIYYTTDETDPTSSTTAQKYSAALSIAATTTVKAAAKDASGAYSNVITKTYTIEKSIANTLETAYTTEEAIALIGSSSATQLAEKVYVKGTVSEVGSYSSTYGSITYWLDDNAFEVYGGLNNNGEKFTDINDIVTGAEVVVYGTITKFGSTYEFSQNNWLVSYTAPANAQLTPTITYTYTNKLTANGNADTYDVAYDGDGTLSVTSSEGTVATATISGNTVTVTPLAAGTTTITVSASETNNYLAATKSYTLTVSAAVEPAALPFTFNGGKSDIATTTGMSQSGLGTDYSSAPKLKFDNAGDYVIIYYGEDAKSVTYTIKGNSTNSDCVFDVLESADGETYTTVCSHKSDIPTTATEYTQDLTAASRYVKFVYTTKAYGNVALGGITIKAASALESPELAFENEVYTFTAGADDMEVAAASAKQSTGAITYTCDDSNLTINATTGVITCTTPGTYTVAAIITADGNYDTETATCTVKIIEEITPNAIILATTGNVGDEKYFAMTNVNASSYFGSCQLYKLGDKYIYDEQQSTSSILFKVATTDGKTTIQNPADGKYVQATAAKAVSLSEDSYSWTNDGEKLTAADDSYGTLQYNSSNPRFTTYKTKTGQYATIVEDPTLAAGYGRNVTTDDWGTLCLSYNVPAAQYDGMDIYDIDSKVVDSEGTVTAIVLKEHEGQLIGGYSYIFHATASTLVCEYNLDYAINTAVKHAGMQGNLSDDALTVPDGSYVISNNTLRKVNGGIATVAKNRAYIDLTDVEEYSASSDAKGLVFMSMDGAGTATSINALCNLQNEQTANYNLAGQRVSNGYKGIIIKNGKKVAVK